MPHERVTLLYCPRPMLSKNKPLSLFLDGVGRERRSGFEAMTFNKEVHAAILRFSTEDLMPESNLGPNSIPIVDSARLILSLEKKAMMTEFENSTQITFTLYQLMPESEKMPEAAIAMDTQVWSLNELANQVEFDSTEIIQSWLMDTDSNNGIRIDCNLCHQHSIEFTNEDVKLALKITSTAKHNSLITRRATITDKSWQKSSQSQSCPLRSNKKRPRCCRESMRVDFSSIPGFEFIQQPRFFDAYMCRGRCTPRLNPLNDHSLLQSIMHIKTRHLEDINSRVHRPCCVGTKFEPLDILHVDDQNPTKLKVTHWKDVIVAQCGCA